MFGFEIHHTIHYNPLVYVSTITGLCIYYNFSLQNLLSDNPPPPLAHCLAGSRFGQMGMSVNILFSVTCVPINVATVRVLVLFSTGCPNNNNAVSFSHLNSYLFSSHSEVTVAIYTCH